MGIGTTVKRLLRRLVPDRLVARYRLSQHSRFSRVNVDVFLSDKGDAKRWLDTTPDTYRIRLDTPVGRDAPNIVEVGDADLHVSDGVHQRVRRLLADSEIDAALVAEVPRPRLVDRRRSEPQVGPRLIVTTRAILEEVGGVPPGDHPLPGLLARLRDAGLRLGLVPIQPGGAATERTDAVETTSIVVLSAVPLHDIGGGSRSAQLALEFLKRGFHVSYVSMYEAQESNDLGLRYVSPNLEQHKVASFDARAFAKRVRKPGLVLVEAPATPLGEQAFQLRDAGWVLVYDMIDDWSDPALGGEWYAGDLEQRLVGEADLLIASASDLTERVVRMGGEAELVPNAVNGDIFGVAALPRPDDLPDTGLVIGYHGSLYGDWFDWEALRSVAMAYPDAGVVVIGDDQVERPAMPANVTFLGLKAQTELPAYLQRFDVGIIPFEVSDTTHAVSPLKAYEYLASGVPVAAPPLRSLETLEGAFLADSLPEAVASAIVGARPSPADAIAKHSWANRAEQLLAATGIESGRGAEAIKPVSRPVRHHHRDARLLR